MSKKIVVLASGSGTLAESIFSAVADGTLDATISVLICDNLDAAVIDRAHKYSIPVNLHPMKVDRALWNLELLQLLNSLAPALVISAGFMRILDLTITSTMPIINSHPSLLPAFPGAHAVRDALAAGVTTTGTTIHWVNAGVDTGAIIAQVPIEITAGESEESLHERIKILERSLIVATIAQILPTLEPR